MPDGNSEEFKRVETIEKDVQHIGVTCQRTVWYPTGKTQFQVIVRTMGSYAVFSPEELAAIADESRAMLRALGRSPNAEK